MSGLVRVLLLAIVGVGLLVYALASSDAAQPPPDRTPFTCDRHEVRHHVARARGIARATYAERKWRDGSPARHHQHRWFRWHVRCIYDPPTDKRLRGFKKRQKRQFYRERSYQLAIRPPGPGVLAAIRACESGTSGGYRAVSSDGSYRGAYQFDYQTWASVGGRGDPAAAAPREQDRRAGRLYRARGSSPWPVCGV